MPLADYELTEVLYRSERVVVRRGKRKSDGLEVVLKQPGEDAMSFSRYRKLRYEHKILGQLNARGVGGIPSAVEYDEESTPTLITKSIGGIALREILARRSLTLVEALSIACDVTRALAAVHAVGAIHKDINPSNIVWNEKNNTVELIDFGISTFVKNETQVGNGISLIEGTLDYLPPEQTGRLNKTLDERSDLYALGATLFVMLTKTVPLKHPAANELIHAILTQRPKSVCDYDASLPPVVGEIIGKLLEKEPEIRYQRASGLLQDLDTCLTSLRRSGAIAPFALGAKDHSSVFVIPQKLYGREREAEALTDSYKQMVAQKRKHVVLLSGPSGIGKSALVAELQGHIIYDQGLFAGGKHEQLRRHIPFLALSQGVSGLIRRILLEDARTVDLWKRRFEDALHVSGRVVVDCIPAIAQLFQPEQAVAALPPQEAEQRLLALMARFFYVLCRDQPLVIFLDDMQWADLGTLKLLKLMLSDDQPMQGLLIVCAYRDNEVNNLHPFTTFINDISGSDTRVQRIAVAPLSSPTIASMVMDATFAPAEEAAKLATLVSERTAGNPFFVHEFLRSLNTRGVLTFDGEKLRWVWDNSAVRNMHVTNNVVDLVAHEMSQLATAEREALSVAACLGAEFKLSDLSTVRGCSPTEAVGLLDASLKLRIIHPVDRAYRYVHDADSASGADETEVGFKFAHDRIQQAAYEMLDASQAAQLHYKIGRSLLKRYANIPVHEWIFEVVDHLNRSRSMCRGAERVELATLNLEAGRETRKALAYNVSIEYLNNGIELLDDKGWQDHGALTRDIYSALAVSKILLGDPKGAHECLDILLNQAKTPTERAEVQRQRTVAFITQGRWEEGVDAGRAALKYLKHPVTRTKQPSMASVVVQFLRTGMLLSKSKIPQLIDAPTIVREHEARVLEVLATTYFCAFNYNANLQAILSLELARFTLVYGNSRMSANAYACLSVAFVQQYDYGMAVPVGYLSAAFLKKFPDSTTPGLTYAGTTAFVLHVVEPPRKLAERFRNGVQAAIESGDAYWTHILMFMELDNCLRYSISEAMELADTYAKQIELVEDPFRRSLLDSVAQAARRFAGVDRSPAELDNSLEGKSFPTPSTEMVFHMCKLWTLLIHNDIERAEKHAIKCLSVKDISGSSDQDLNLVYFASGLALTAHAIKHGRRQIADKKHFRTIFKRLNAQAKAGDIYTGFPILVRAQIAVMEGRQQAATTLFEEALQHLAVGHDLSAAAIGYELAARFHLSQGRKLVALGYCQEALTTYRRWGAVVKAEALASEWRTLLKQVEAGAASNTDLATGNERTASTTVPVEIFYLRAFFEFFNALSSEKSMEGLVKRIVADVSKTASADHAVLLLGDRADMVVVGDTRAASVGKKLEALGVNALPKRVIAYVYTSGEPVSLDDDQVSADLIADPYLREKQPKSMLCAPVVFQNKRLGVLYLENSVLSDAFTQDRRELLSVLVAQAAVALENLNLYENLEDVIAKRSDELRVANARLLELERSTTEMQMAGGFAHEMRNGLAGAQYLVTNAFPRDGDSLLTQNRVACEALLQLAKRSMSGDVLNEFTARMREVTENEDQLASIIDVTRDALDRGLAITTLTLDYAQVGNLVARSERTDVQAVLRKLVNEMSPELNTADIDVRLDLPTTMPVMMPESHVYLIFRNLIANARDAVVMRASPAQSRSIALHGRIEAGTVIVDVADNGVGLSSEAKSRIFQPFFSTKGAQGTGLGLAMCKKISGLYEGELSVVSNENDGATFICKLPAADGGEVG